MCTTKLGPISGYTHETLNEMLKRALDHPKSFDVPLLSVETAQRLIGHIDPEWLDETVYDELDTLQSSVAPTTPEQRIIAPTFRSIVDFAGEEVVANIRPDKGFGAEWKVAEPILDETDGRIYIKINPVKYEVFDPRNPMIWPLSVYKIIKERKGKGRGSLDVIAGYANTAIMLGGFSLEPLIPERLASATRRHFSLMGR